MKERHPKWLVQVIHLASTDKAWAELMPSMLAIFLIKKNGLMHLTIQRTI